MGDLLAVICTSAFIHPLAHVESNCTVYGGAKVWQFASVTRWAVIGNRAVIAPGAMIDGSYIGDGSKIGPGVKMGPGFRVGVGCFLGPNVVLCNDAWPRADHDGFDLEALMSGGFTAIQIEAGASIGANATILPGIRIGEGAMIAAGAVVGVDVPPKHLYHRNGDVHPIDAATPRTRMRRVRVQQ